MLYYVLALCLFAVIFASYFPTLYVKKKNLLIQQSKELDEETFQVKPFFSCSVLLFLTPLLMFYLSQNIYMAVFCFVFAVLAYTDLSARWLPDIPVYLLMVLSVMGVDKQDMSECIISSLFFVAPAVLLNFLLRIKGSKSFIAAGDFYVLPSIGLMIRPEHAAGLMLLILFQTVFMSRLCKQIPLITVTFSTFCGYQICLLLSLF